HRGRAVGRAVVDDDDLPGSGRLRQDSREGGVERARGVVGRDHDGDVEPLGVVHEAARGRASRSLRWSVTIRRKSPAPSTGDTTRRRTSYGEVVLRFTPAIVVVA